MTIRIRAKPDANGLITVSCGADTIEIEVMAGPAASGGGGYPFIDVPGGPFVSGGGGYNPFEEPILTLVNPYDAEHAMVTVGRELSRAPLKPGQHTVLIRSPSIDVHQIARLGARLSDLPHSLCIAVDSGSNNR